MAWPSLQFNESGRPGPSYDDDPTDHDNDDDDLFASDAVAELTLITEELFLTAEWRETRNNQRDQCDDDDDDDDLPAHSH